MRPRPRGSLTPRRRLLHGCPPPPPASPTAAVGGAVATASHGSSMKYGSLSSQLRGLKLLVADGTVLEVTPKSDPHLFRAAGVSVGRLGVLVEVTLKIKRQQAVKRSLQGE